MTQKCKVFIVEDELITRQALRYILSQNEDKYCIVGEALNGKDAQEIIERERPHVVICDIVMPVMDGIELTKWLQLRYPETYIIILSSYGNFEYVKSSFQYGAFEYILKPQLEPEKLLHILHRISVELHLDTCHVKQESLVKQPMILQQVLSGHDLTINEQNMGRYKAPFFSVIGCQLRKLIGYKKDKEHFYYDSLIEAFKKHLGESLVEYALTSDGQILGLINMSEEQIKEWNIGKGALAEKIGTSIVGVKMACSDVIDKWDALPQNILEVKEFTSKQFFVPNELFVYSFKDTHLGKKPSFSHGGYRVKLESGLYREAFELLSGFVESQELGWYYTEQELKKIVEHVLYTTFNYLEEAKFDLKKLEFNKLQVLSMISSMYSIEDLRKFVEKVLEEIYNQVIEVRQGEHTIILQIYKYIDTHFNEPLTLHEVAKEFHMSYSYLSTYFSHATNKGFNEYLNAVRIDKAKELLGNSDIPIAFIGEKVGYIDQSYFSKVFKKNVGQSPTAYRRNKLKRVK